MPPLTLQAATAAEIMNPGPVSIAHTDTVPDAVAFLTERGFGAGVVIDDAGHPLGVVTKTDVLVHTQKHKPGLEPDDTPVTEVMTPAVFSVRPETSAQSVVEQLLEIGVHHLFVTDATGIVVGVISPVDVLRKLK
jgi:CBS-domain-containing membrane protein